MPKYYYLLLWTSKFFFTKLLFVELLNNFDIGRSRKSFVIIFFQLPKVSYYVE